MKKMTMLLVAMLAMAACERAPQPAEAEPEPPGPASEPVPAEATDPTGGLAPPLLTPGENTPSPQEPSYEVSIASVAAEHNNALKRCATQPEAVRTQCEQEANAAFADARTNLETLRGNQE
jgi:LmbE family N-acetylglucosaminyl deacetylase